MPAGVREGYLTALAKVAASINIAKSSQNRMEPQSKVRHLEQQHSQKAGGNESKPGPAPGPAKRNAGNEEKNVNHDTREPIEECLAMQVQHLAV